LGEQRFGTFWCYSLKRHNANFVKFGDFLSEIWVLGIRDIMLTLGHIVGVGRGLAFSNAQGSAYAGQCLRGLSSQVVSVHISLLVFIMPYLCFCN
jgi:hypothetical protein